MRLQVTYGQQCKFGRMEGAASIRSQGVFAAACAESVQHLIIGLMKHASSCRIHSLVLAVRQGSRNGLPCTPGLAGICACAGFVQPGPVICWQVMLVSVCLCCLPNDVLLLHRKAACRDQRSAGNGKVRSTTCSPSRTGAAEQSRSINDKDTSVDRRTDVQITACTSGTPAVMHSTEPSISQPRCERAWTDRPCLTSVRRWS